MSHDVINISRHILEQQRQSPGATGELSILLNTLALAAKISSHEVNRAGLGNVLGHAGYQNVQGEQVTKLDIFTHNLLHGLLGRSGQVCVMASEEAEHPLEIPEGYPNGKYVVLFDPLDGSANLEINASVGMIFSVFRRVSSGGKGTIEDCLQAGRHQVCAGYVVYGASTMLVYSTGHGVHGFTLDPAIGEFLLSHENIRIPKKGTMYSINEGRSKGWPPGIVEYLNSIKSGQNGPTYNLRYIGAAIADVHRTLLTGGIFLHPASAANPKGKLRLLYEASPLAFLVEQAGGRASDGKQPILEIQPESLHQRVPMIIGSVDDVLTAERFIREAEAKAYYA